MADDPLAGARILVAEDEYLLAEELQAALVELGTRVIGPAASLADALALIETADARLDAAILDINLGGEPAFVAADRLARDGIPLIFVTGYDAAALPARFRLRPLLEKPVDLRRVAALLREMIGALPR
ncbi:response regulator [Sphingopyxis terrae]|uniref:Response regulator receiver domain-containing protein n=1 Tax=Sphingopyxis terrae subsp. ummariensis TaxID=429001 RepID=A0A1Y6FNE1_9SPHN|nr:response regulator [Sphingopyxis terrae]PCF91317.1 DNA-binding response regulator [Sphingopyxis terrae subsp. ummariensis]SMQ76488.1 Response regulator receiver domain-containing protein [Sphingopyxis terrae subsp. ummariensis]